MGFLKFKEKPANGGDASNIHWYRADRDGAPFRGDEIPILKNEEFEELAQRVYDSKVGIFNSSDPSQKQHGRTYQEVLDGVQIGWFKLLTDRQYKWVTDDQGNSTMLVYVEWSEPYMQLPKGATDNTPKIIGPGINYAKSK